jgi:hypothetical protein
MPATAVKTPTIPDQAIKEPGRKWIYGIEIFKSGRWNYEKYGHEWTREELAGMVEAFTATLEEVEPVITTNHGKDEDQGVNRGFIGRLYLSDDGDTLLMDALVDEDLFEGMKAARYRRPSVELYPDYEDQHGRAWPWVVTCASIQGGKNIEAVRTLEPLARALAHQHSQFVPLHFREGARSRAITVTFDQGVPQMEEMLQKIMALCEQIAAALPKASEPPAEMMHPEKEEKEMSEGGAPAASAPAAPAAAPASAPAAQSSAEVQPTQITLKYEQDLSALQQKVVLLEKRAQIAETASRQQTEKVALRERVAKFAESGNLRIPPAMIETVADIAARIPATGGKLKFADATGAEKEDVPREAFFALLGALPDQTDKTRRQSKDLSRPARSDAMTFAADVERQASEKGISRDQAWEQAVEALDAEEFAAMIFPDLAQ